MESNVEKAQEPIDLDTLDGRLKVSKECTSGSFDVFKSVMESMAAKFTPEYLEELSKISYDDDRTYPENFSNWYNHIINFGCFAHADIIANQIFTFEDTKIIKKTDDYKKVDWESINEILKPTLDKMEKYKVYNIKNGCFSNKFDFETSLATKDTLAQQLWKINYQSSMLDTGGFTELVVRELIPYNNSEIPTIYNGMPMREEIRVFYNMDRNIVEYVEDYWKYKYCANNIRNKSDKIVFDWFHNKLKTRKIQHREKIKELTDFIYNNIGTLKFDGALKGIWSIDFMWVEETNKLYLIDMARGFRSAYWNIDKLTYKSYLQIQEERKNK